MPLPPREPLGPQPTIGSDVDHNPSYASDLHPSTVRPRPRPWPSQDLLQRRRLQLQPSRRPLALTIPRPTLSTTSSPPAPTPMSLPLPEPVAQPDNEPYLLACVEHYAHKTGRENNEQGPCAAPPFAPCNWTLLPPRRMTSWISPPRSGAHNVRTSSLLPPNATCTVPTTKPPSSSNDHPQPHPTTTHNLTREKPTTTRPPHPTRLRTNANAPLGAKHMPRHHLPTPGSHPNGASGIVMFYFLVGLVP